MARQTKQKKVLNSHLNSFTSFFTAEDLFAKVKEEIGIATIYRYLKSLVDQGEIHSYLCDRRTIYSLNKKSHCHFTCEVCSEKKHIALKKLDFLQSQVPGKICHFQVDVTGICESCSSKTSS
ncbi:hypothetical protein COV20_00225 [Candidatus Woesearchaeota archaeon CG10_big_fil_rev_8_21_14_0_10_45_16]|nr:MAG: hypothetical protein COV20_00225 [Candidatus Woesearchaeota archaeon CG10_big_fil_rev_8_21_14_0_10_45_16]